MESKPLVSVIIPNYNYAHFLENCLDSVLAQTYPNMEVIFRDNNSDDQSYDIALKYRDPFKAKGCYFSAVRNRRNIGSSANTALGFHESEGDYIIYLSSDDSWEPTFIQRCADILTNHPNVGMVMVHRDELDENGAIKQIPPFYNRSCIIPGEEQAAVFMLAGIAVPSQILIRRSMIYKVFENRAIAFQIAADWYNNFIISCHSDIAYIADPLCKYRVHRNNETSESMTNLVMVFEHYLLINACAALAKSYGMSKAYLRYEEAVKKLGDMCLRYAFRMFKYGRKDVAGRYLQLAPVFKEDLPNDTIYNKFMTFLSKDMDELAKEIQLFEKMNPMERTVSYTPPDASIPIS